MIRNSCVRCAGLLIAEWLRDHSGPPVTLPAQRCVNCGDVIDRVILERRRLYALLQAWSCPVSSRCAAVVRGETVQPAEPTLSAA